MLTVKATLFMFHVEIGSHWLNKKVITNPLTSGICGNRQIYANIMTTLDLWWEQNTIMETAKKSSQKNSMTSTALTKVLFIIAQIPWIGQHNSNLQVYQGCELWIRTWLSLETTILWVGLQWIFEYSWMSKLFGYAFVNHIFVTYFINWNYNGCKAKPSAEN